MKFEVGSKVIVPLRYGTSHYDIKAVSKVHKNGNFSIEGSPQQYRPHGDSAKATGDTGWRQRSVFLATEENIARFDGAILRDRLMVRADIVKAQIEHIHRAHFSIEDIEALEAIIERINAR